MENFSRIVLVACCLCGGAAIGQDKSRDVATSKNVTAAKKQMMAPETMASAKKSMMGKGSVVPGMVAREMVQQEMMQDKQAMGMVEKATMAKKPDDKMMMSDDHVSMASERMMTEPAAMQTLFQELVARHIASKKMVMMKKADPKMMTMAGQEMKSMMMDEGSMMGAKKDLVASENSAMMMAREELIHSLMLDKEVMAIVEKEAKLQEDPEMAPMISDEKMKMEGEAMMKDKTRAKGMMQETMVRQMVESRQKMMKDDPKPKK